MNRQVVTSTLGRRGVASTLLNTSRPFSTTTTRCAEDDDKKSSDAAAPRAPRAVSPSRQKSEAAVGKLTQLRGSFTSLTSDNSFHKAPPAGARDARRLAAAPINKDGPAGTVTPLGGPKVINVRSLKGTLGNGPRGRFAPGSGNVPGAVSPGAALRPRFGPGGAGRSPSGPGRPRFGAPAAPTGASGAPGGGGRRTGFGARRVMRPRKDGEKKKEKFRGDDYDAPPTEEEKAFVRNLEQGTVTEYVPKLTPDLLLGYGPPVSTDVSLGKVETALRTMRILGGGQPFNPDSGVTSDPTGVKRRYVHEKKPVFFSSTEEKEWVKDSLDKFALSQGPEKKTKKMILETSVLGKYEAPKYVESITDTVKVVEHYQKGTFAYAPSDAEKFMGKLNHLLAAGQPRAAPPAAKKA